MENCVHRLDSINSSSVGFAGGKGASLGELISAGFNVPQGFVVSRVAFDAFLENADPDGRISSLLADITDRKSKVFPIAQEISAFLGPAEIPSSVLGAVVGLYRQMGLGRVAIRSSATCEDGAQSAWAGQLDTYFNVSEAELGEKLKECWLSAFSRRALAYAATHGFDGSNFGVAVVVQEMIPSAISGIGFSVHPVTQEPNLSLIEACFGLGEAIVSGEVSPDAFLLDKETGGIVESSRGNQKKALVLEPESPQPTWRNLGDKGAEPKLTDSQALEYGDILNRIEAHYCRPMDTEWAYYNGGFHVLQARPITTLAPGYDEKFIDDSEPWMRLVKRPFSLLEYSIIGHWTDPKHAAKDLGIERLDHFLGIQDDAGMTHMYFPEPRLIAAHDHLLDLRQNDRDKLIGILEKGKQLYEEGMQRIDNGVTFSSLQEAADYFCEIGKYTVIVPAWLLLAMERVGVDDSEVHERAEWLRGHSVYPRLVHKLLHPYVIEHARGIGFSDPEQIPFVATWDELVQGVDLSVLEARLEAVRSGSRFVYQMIGEEYQVRLLPQTGYLLMRLAHAHLPPDPEDANCLTGQTAWPGFHRGRARLVLSSNPEGYQVDPGDVLVSVQSNPNLMPLLRHAGAIVTDEGGVACHASIVARELKVPAVTGVGNATSAIHDGDLIEVDATEQVVRIIERV
ncbi:MAG: PEP/pyruvate-binding domain-containing protein [Verrucomicrobiota bacterium]